jgi:hypothetical protein
VNSFLWKCVALLALALVVTGCGPGGPRLYKAGGTVTYKDKPVENATVTFLYDDGNFANGVTDSAGKFSLVYLGRPGGAALGKCKVTVAKLESTGPVTPPINQAPKTPEEWKAKNDALMNAGKKGLEKKGAAKSLIPDKYADALKSDLAFEIVSDESKNDFPIVLKD